MATPSLAQLRTDLQNAVNLAAKTLAYGNADATNFRALFDTYNAAINSNYPGARSSGAESYRAALNAMFDSGALRSVIDPVLFDWGQHVGAPEGASPEDILRRMYIWFTENAETVKTRTITYGSPAAGSNTGTGTIQRLTKDSYNYNIENIFPQDSLKAEVVADQNSGRRKNNEQFEVRSTVKVGEDFLAILGSGTVANLDVISSSDAGTLGNAGFDSRGNTDAVPTSITSWELLDSADAALTVSNTYVTFDATNIYNPARNANDTRKSIKLVNAARVKLRQKLNLRGINFDRTRPHYCEVAYNRQVNSAAGTLALHMGSTSVSVAVSAQTGWNVLRIPVGQYNWLRNVDEDNLDILVDWTPNSGGTGILLDDVVFAPFTGIGNTWYYATAGATAFLLEDDFTWSDSFASGISDAIIQYWLWRAYDAYLPHSASPSLTDPS